MQNKNQVFILSGLMAVALLAVGVTTYSLSSSQNGQVSTRPAAQAEEIAYTEPVVTEPVITESVVSEPDYVPQPEPSRPAFCRSLNVAYQFNDKHAYTQGTKSFLSSLQAALGSDVTVTAQNQSINAALVNTIIKSDSDPSPTARRAMIHLPGAAGLLPASPGVAEQPGSLIAETFTSGLPFYMSVKEHADWMYDNGGMVVEQGLVNSTPTMEGETKVKVFPVAASAAEHGMFWQNKIPSTVSELKNAWAGQKIRFFGNGGRLASNLLKFTQLAVAGQTPYQLMMDKTVIGVDFTTPVGDLYDFFTSAGVNIAASINEINPGWACDITYLGHNDDDGDGKTNDVDLDDDADGIPDTEDPVNNVTLNPLVAKDNLSPGCPNIAKLGYNKFYKTGWHQDYNIQDFTIDNDFWSQCLTPAQQNNILKIAKANMISSNASESLQSPAALAAITELVTTSKTKGAEVFEAWPTAVLDYLKSNANDYYENLAGINPDGFGRVLNSMKRFKAYNPTGAGAQ